MEQVQLESDHTWIKYCLAAIICVSVVSVLVCGGLVFKLASESGESTPIESERWFERVIQANPSAFTDIKHYTLQGIDYSHHFRFQFSNMDDLSSIIKHHGLSPAPNGEAIQKPAFPSWYDPLDVSPNSRMFARGGTEPVLLIVDPDQGLAYFEFVHL